MQALAPKDFGASRGILRLRRTIPLLIEEGLYARPLRQGFVRQAPAAPYKSVLISWGRLSGSDSTELVEVFALPIGFGPVGSYVLHS
jgi:hypothetical protein